MGNPRPWSELEAESRFTVELDGFAFVLAEPSALQLAARGVIPPAAVTGKAGTEPGGGSKLVMDESVQNGLLESSLIEPRVCAACTKVCEHEMVPIAHISRQRDRLVLAILNRLFDTEVVRGARFRSGVGDGSAVRPDRAGVGPSANGSSRPAGKRVRSGSGVAASSGS